MEAIAGFPKPPEKPGIPGQINLVIEILEIHEIKYKNDEILYWYSYI